MGESFRTSFRRAQRVKAGTVLQRLKNRRGQGSHPEAGSQSELVVEYHRQDARLAALCPPTVAAEQRRKNVSAMPPGMPPG